VTHSPVGTVPSGEVKKNTFIIFIAGNADSSGISDGTNQIDWINLGYAFDVEESPGNTYYNNSEVHFFLVFPYCDNLVSGLTFIKDGSINLPVCNDFTAFNNHQAYIASWKQAFETDTASLFDAHKLLTFYAAANKIYTLGTPGSSLPGTFYKQKSNGSDDTSFSASYYPGYPSLEIDDGNPDIYHTKDIWLNDLDPLDTSIPQAERDLYDNYEAGQDNKISVRVHIRGTHPVKDFNVGVSVFRTGGGGDCDFNPSSQRPVQSTQLLRPGDDYVYSYNEYFEPQYSHQCIRARASLNVINDSDIDNATDWDFTGRINEAQLNIDPGGVAKSAAGQGGTGTDEQEPGGGMVDENNPGQDAEPDTSTGVTGSKSLRNLRGYFEHVYHIHNRFKTVKEFRIIIPEILNIKKDLINARWFLIDPKYPGRLIELNKKGQVKQFVSITLKPGRNTDLVLYLNVRNTDELKITNIPFDILVEDTPVWMPRIFHVFFYKARRFRLYSGIKVVLSNSSGDIIVRITDRKKNPVKGAYVFVKTLDGRQSAAIKSSKDGTCDITGINTGSYKLWAVFNGAKTKEHIVNLHNKKREKIELVFDF